MFALVQYVFSASTLASDVTPDATIALIPAVVGGIIGAAGTAAIEFFKRRSVIAPHLTLTSGAVLDLAISVGLGKALLENGMMNDGPNIRPDNENVSNLANQLDISLKKVADIVRSSSQFLPESVVREFVVLEMSVGNLIDGLRANRTVKEMRHLVDAGIDSLHTLGQSIAKAQVGRIL